MNPITYGSINYKSPYGKEVLQSRMSSGSGLHSQINADSYSSKRKIKKDNTVVRILTTAGLMALSAFAAYKGKGKIQNVMDSAGKHKGKVVDNFAKKCPNMSQAVSSFVKACKSPFKAIGNLFTKKK